MIRKAVFADLEAIYELGKRIHAQSADHEVELHELTTKSRLAGLIASKSGLVLVDETPNGITGVLVAFCEEFFFSREKYAVPLVNYAERRGAFVWMTKRFLKWAFEYRGAKQVVADCSFGGGLGEKSAAIYERLGMRRSGSTYILMRGEA